MVDFSRFDDGQLDALRVDVLTEQERRANLEQIPAQVTELATQGRVIGVEEQVMVEAVTKHPEPEPE